MPHTHTHTPTHTGAQPHPHTHTRTHTEAKPHGFTLVETAIIVIIIGIIAALVIPAITSRITTDRGAQGRGDVISVRDEIIGFAMVKNAVGGFSLPRQDLSADLQGYMHIDDYNSLPKARAGDFWSQPFLYRIDEALSNGQNLCYVNNGDITLNIEQGAGSRTVAFIVKSNGPNMQNNIPDFDDISTVDFNLTIGQAGDDIVEFVTLDYLKGRLSCPSGAPGTPFVALDFSEISDRAELVGHPGVTGAGTDVSISNLSGIGNVLELGGTYGGGTTTTSWVELDDVSDPNDICGYTLMGWFRTPGSVLPERRQYITSRRPSHGGSYNTWSVSINSRIDPCLSSSGFCTQVTPPGETGYGASDDGGGGVSAANTFAASLDTAGRGNSYLHSGVSPTRRGNPIIPDNDGSGSPPDDYKQSDVRIGVLSSPPPYYEHYGQIGDPVNINSDSTSSWHFFAVNLVPNSLNNEETDIHNGRCRFINADDPPAHIAGSYALTNYISENNDGDGVPSGQHRLFARQEIYYQSATQYGPIATYLSGSGSYRIFIGRLGADTGSWVNPFRGQISRFFIYTKDQLLTHDQIVAYYNNTCPIFSGNPNCRYTRP